MPTPQTKQAILVEIANVPGALAEVADLVADRGLNIFGYALCGEGRKGKAHLVVSDPQAAAQTLGQAGFRVSARDILLVSAPNRPGQLSTFATRLSESGVNIETSFIVIAPRGAEPRIAFACDEMGSAAKVLSG